MNSAPQTAAKSPAAGARPEGVAGEKEASARVREMFGGIAPRYDFLNHVLSLSLDRLWRRRVARRFRLVLDRPEARVLDLCCGTADLTLALARRSRATIYGSDFAHPMLIRAAQKARAFEKRQGDHGTLAGFIEADALSLPVPDNSFDLVTVAFGFRNLANYDRGLREIFRILRPSGRIGILEFAQPKGRLFGGLYRFYFSRILPKIGGAISGSNFAYSYLPNSVQKFPEPEELARRMTAAGFIDPRCELWTGGTVALHTAKKL
ncbi:MAG TPA: bifunctional demethylmenaquinone methyltransferase/2-methoxy-6-polyprenyl-1,4-benzoquinol methylase UbiE [Candidatus Acidoferrales bacterium]|nr:bifunctional demethylmenaquinone methyltransferase/2-methoxy-6-polyprenyl-1,4-benzoquinol methylase UbiE [Candidatus Acidoferrales bacterium]